MFRIIYTLKTVTEHVEQQYKRLQSYKVLMNLTYIFSYVIITPVIIAFFYIWHNPLFRTVIVRDDTGRLFRGLFYLS